MRLRNSLRLQFALVALILAAMVTTAFGGPPLVCFPFDIGSAKSLPWGGGADARSWNNARTDYRIRQLPDDTLAILTDSTPVIVRMETIRRAAIYAAKDRTVARDLLARLRQRAETATHERNSALMEFDYGYLIETMRQVHTGGTSLSDTELLAGLSGYPHIQKAIRSREDDAELQFAAALVTVWPRNANHQTHLSKAVLGAENDTLLSKNLLKYYSDHGKDLAELRASLALKETKD